MIHAAYSLGMLACFGIGYLCEGEDMRKAAWGEIRRPKRLCERPDIRAVITWQP